MKNIVKSVVSASVIAAFSMLPLAASAYSIGVNNSINSSIEQGHTSSRDYYSESHNGVEGANSSSYKYGTSDETGHTDGLVIDPASTNNTITGHFNEGASTTAYSHGTYSKNASGYHAMDGGSQVNTSLSLGVGTYFNP